MMSVTIARRSVPVDSFAEASAKVRRYVESRGMGGAAYYRSGSGAVRIDGRHVAHVAFNGRVFEGEASAWTWARLWQDIARAYRGEYLSDNEMDDLTSRWPS